VILLLHAGRWLESQNLVGWWCGAFVRLGFEEQQRLQLQVGILGHSPAHAMGLANWNEFEWIDGNCGQRDSVAYGISLIELTLRCSILQQTRQGRAGERIIGEEKIP